MKQVRGLGKVKMGPRSDMFILFVNMFVYRIDRNSLSAPTVLIALLFKNQLELGETHCSYLLKLP